MSKKMLGVVFIILGVIVLVVSLAADAVGIGNATGIGWKQILAAVIGALVALDGIFLVFRNPDQKK
jgi:hypothetical protein